jgi:hypothetical protein
MSCLSHDNRERIVTEGYKRASMAWGVLHRRTICKVYAAACCLVSSPGSFSRGRGFGEAAALFNGRQSTISIGSNWDHSPPAAQPYGPGELSSILGYADGGELNHIRQPLTFGRRAALRLSASRIGGFGERLKEVGGAQINEPAQSRKVSVRMNLYYGDIRPCHGTAGHLHTKSGSWVGAGTPLFQT